MVGHAVLVLDGEKLEARSIQPSTVVVAAVQRSGFVGRGEQLHLRRGRDYARGRPDPTQSENPSLSCRRMAVGERAVVSSASMHCQDFQIMNLYRRLPRRQWSATLRFRPRFLQGSQRPTPLLRVLQTEVRGFRTAACISIRLTGKNTAFHP